MSELYILFERSNSTIGKLGRLFIPYPYTHVTISFDRETFYSFSRRKYHDPFNAGFTEEKLSYFAYEEVEVKIYTLNISETEKMEILNFMDRIRDDPFDIMDMLTMPILHGWRRNNAYNCMSFVSEVLEMLSYPLPHPRYKNNIEDIEKSLISKGLKGEILYLPKQIDEDYMAEVSLKEKLHSFFRLINQLYGK